MSNYLGLYCIIGGPPMDLVCLMISLQGQNAELLQIIESQHPLILPHQARCTGRLKLKNGHPALSAIRPLAPALDVAACAQ